jgi:hypothetical protein
MADKNRNFYDDLDVGDVPKAKGVKFSSGGSSKFVIIGIIFLIVIALIFVFIFNTGNSKTSTAVKNLPIAESDSEVSAVKSFAIQFLDKFYWYNRDTFLEVREDLEKMMTTDFLIKFKPMYHDNKLEQLITDSNLIMSYKYDAIMYKKDATGTYARVVGDVIYTNGLTGGSTSTSDVWTLKIVNEDDQYKVADLIINVGKK